MINPPETGLGGVADIIWYAENLYQSTQYKYLLKPVKSMN